jgi:hypothetical protein
MTSFHDILKNGYVKDKKNNLNGYILDNQLSDHNHQVYYHPENKKLLYNVTGTHNKSDWIDNIKLATGIGFKNTKRYNDEKETLKKAKTKYVTDNAIISGHSLGGAYASYISDPNKDHVITLDKASTIGQKSRSNEENYIKRGDLVGAFGDKNKYFGNHTFDFLHAHKVDHSRDLNIFV